MLLPFARDELLRSIAAAADSVDLASPYISAPVAEDIAASVHRSAARARRLITAVTERSVRAGALSVAALEVLLDAGFEVRSIPNLHAKLSIVDRTWGLVGSGNLTGAGLGTGGPGTANVELGVRLTAAQTRVAAAIFDGWWNDPAAGPVTPRALAPFAALPVPPAAPNDGVAPIGSPLLLAAESTSTSTKPLSGAGHLAPRRYWVKAMYGHGKPRSDWWLERTWIHDRHRDGAASGTITFRPSYGVGDLIGLYVTRPSGPGRIPAVFEVTGIPYDGRALVAATFGEQEAAKYGWVTGVTVIRSTSIADAPEVEVAGKTPRSLQIGRTEIRDRAAFAELERRIPLLVRDDARPSAPESVDA